MKKYHFNSIKWVCILGLIIGVGLGCSTPQRWYKTGHSKLDFILDERECQIMAEELARQETISGTGMDRETYNRISTNCLFSRGWRHTPRGNDQENGESEVLATINENRVSVFGKQFLVPDGFNLISNQVDQFEDVKRQILNFKAKGALLLTITFEQATSRKFDLMDTPVKEPLFIFEHGQSKQSGCDINWAVSFGEIKKRWIAEISEYLNIEPMQRISIVISTDISPPESIPPKGLRLAKNQKVEIESFSAQWLEIVKQGFGISN